MSAVPLRWLLKYRNRPSRVEATFGPARGIPAAPSEYATSLAPLEAWFKDRVLAISGIDRLGS